MSRGYSTYFDKSLARTFAVALAAPSVLVGCVGPSVTGSFDRTLAVSGPVQLEVHNGSGLVEIRTGQDGQVRVHGNYSVWGFAFENARADADDLASHPPIEQVGNAVQVGLRRYTALQSATAPSTIMQRKASAASFMTPAWITPSTSPLRRKRV